VVGHVKDRLREEKRVVRRCDDAVRDDVVDKRGANGPRVREEIDLAV